MFINSATLENIGVDFEIRNKFYVILLNLFSLCFRKVRKEKLSFDKIHMYGHFSNFDTSLLEMIQLLWYLNLAL